MTAPRWVGWWFRGAAIYGAIVLVALFVRPAPSTGALFYYAFAGTAMACQLVFWVIGGDPVRHRALIAAAVVEKIAFVVPVLAMAPSLDRAAIAAGVIDLILGAGFILAWRATPA